MRKQNVYTGCGMKKKLTLKITEKTKRIFWGAAFVFGGVFVLADMWIFIERYGMPPPVFQYGLGAIAGTAAIATGFYIWFLSKRLHTS